MVQKVAFFAPGCEDSPGCPLRKKRTAVFVSGFLMMKTSSCQDRLETNTPQGKISLETLQEVACCPQARTGEGVNTIAVRLGLQEHDSFLSFPYACPEPGLVK